MCYIILIVFYLNKSFSDVKAVYNEPDLIAAIDPSSSLSLSSSISLSTFLHGAAKSGRLCY